MFGIRKRSEGHLKAATQVLNKRAIERAAEQCGSGGNIGASLKLDTTGDRNRPARSEPPPSVIDPARWCPPDPARVPEEKFNTQLRQSEVTLSLAGVDKPTTLSTSILAPVSPPPVPP